MFPVLKVKKSNTRMAASQDSFFFMDGSFLCPPRAQCQESSLRPLLWYKYQSHPKDWDSHDLIPFQRPYLLHNTPGIKFQHTDFEGQNWHIAVISHWRS